MNYRRELAESWLLLLIAPKRSSNVLILAQVDLIASAAVWCSFISRSLAKVLIQRSRRLYSSAASAAARVHDVQSFLISKVPFIFQ